MPQGCALLQSEHTENNSSEISGAASAACIYERKSEDGGGRFERLWSRNLVTADSPTGESGEYSVGDCRIADWTTGGSQFAVLFVNRCRPGSDEQCLCRTFVLDAEEYVGEQEHVATLTASEHTATSTSRALQVLRRGLSRFVSRNILDAELPCFYHTEEAPAIIGNDLRNRDLTTTCHPFGSAYGPRWLHAGKGIFQYFAIFLRSLPIPIHSFVPERSPLIPQRRRPEIHGIARSASSRLRPPEALTSPATGKVCSSTSPGCLTAT